MNEFREEKDKNKKENVKFKVKTNLKDLRKSAKGITLIALVITIVLNSSYLAMARMNKFEKI